MEVFITGGTGFIGRALVQRLLRDGHRIAVWTRSPAGVPSRLGPDVEAVDAAGGDAALRARVERADAVVNLAGANLAARRWTKARKRTLVASRVDLTERLVDAIAKASRRPAALVSASAVGYYGDRGDEALDEDAPPADDFLGRLCRDWEAAAARAEPLGIRVARLRFGVVLGAEGGALARMLPAFRAGLGTRLGTGRQWMPWVHLRDVVEVIAAALDDERFTGPWNVVAPGIVTNRDFTAALARAVRRPAPLAVPAPALRLALGDMAGVLLASERVVPRRLETLGWRFFHPRLDEALESILAPEREPRIETRPPPPGELDRDGGPRPTYRLTHVTRVDAPLDQVFDFFSNAGNLALLTPAWTDFRFVSPPPERTREGEVIDYRLRLGPVPLRWQTRIRAWDPPRRLVDVQSRGPYRLWWHEHRFEADGDGTRVEDRVWYRLPLGSLGRVAHRLVVAPLLRRIFAYRAAAISLRFGRPHPTP